MKIVFASLIAYLLGSIPFPYIVTKLRTGKDIRQIGTKNMGSGNVFHNVGIFEGLIVLILDVGKGILATYIAYLMHFPHYAIAIVGFFAVLGHDYPIFLGFKGGKGAATTLGILIFISVVSLGSRGIPFLAIVLTIYIILLSITRSQVVTLFFIFPIYPFLMYGFNKDWKLFIVNIIFMFFVEYTGFSTFKRDLTKVRENWRKKNEEER